MLFIAVWSVNADACTTQIIYIAYRIFYLLLYHYVFKGAVAWNK